MLHKAPMSVRDRTELELKQSVGAMAPHPSTSAFGMTPHISTPAFGMAPGTGHFDFRDGHVPFAASFAAYPSRALQAPGLDNIFSPAPSFSQPLYGHMEAPFDQNHVPFELQNPAVSAVGAGMQTELMQARALSSIYTQTPQQGLLHPGMQQGLSYPLAYQGMNNALQLHAQSGRR
jgi:hypothetical protein